MTVTAWSYGVAFAMFLALAVRVGFARTGGIHRAALFAASTASALWALGGWAFAVSRSFPLLVAASTADVLRIGAWYVFLILLLGGTVGAEAARRRQLLTRVAAALVGLALFSVLAAAQSWHVLGPPGHLTMLAALGLAVFALVLVETLYRNVSADARWQVKPLCIGLAAAFGFDIYVYTDAVLFNHVALHAFSVRGFVNAAVVPLIAMGVARTGTWGGKVSLSHRIIFHSAALVATGGYLLVVAATGYYVRIAGGEWGPAFQVALLFAGLVGLCVLMASGSMRARLRVFVAKHFHPHRYDYREEWLRFTRTLASSDDEAAVGQQIVRGLANLVESPGGALWLRHGDEYAQKSRWNMSETQPTEPADGALVAFLRDSGWVVDLDEYRSAPGRYGDLRIPEWLSELPSAWLVVPLASTDNLIGFVVLATPRARIAIDWEVGDLLKTAGRQAASFVGHMQATEALLEARKFDAFNRMSAFVVHDLKNLVAQLSLMLRNAERHRHNAEFQEDMLTTVQHVVQRMQHLMMQLRDGNTPVQAAAPVNVADLVRRVARTKQGQLPAPELDIQEDVIARGHTDRIERVIGHLVQNAIDASEKTGHVRVVVQRTGDRAVVEVRDDGCGMTPEFARERLFRPFQTTKSGGMGIGAYESLHYVRDIGGDIVVDTEPGAGTTMRVLLPVHQDALAARAETVA